VRIRLRQGDYGWLALAAGITVFELWAEEDELLSRAAARYKQRAPLTVTSVVLVTAFHLLGWLAPERDPYVLALRVLRPVGPPVQPHTQGDD
jgi:hypothetical protein